MTQLAKLFLTFTLALLISCKDKEIEFHFQTLTYHYNGQGCEGHCPTYHLLIDSSKKILLHVEYAYKSTIERERIQDSVYLANKITDSTIYTDSVKNKIRTAYRDDSRVGYFSGQLSDNTFLKLTSTLESLGLDTLQLENIRCLDAGNEILKIKYNGRDKLYQNSCPQKKLFDLIRLIDEMSRQNNLTRLTDKVIIPN